MAHISSCDHRSNERQYDIRFDAANIDPHSSCFQPLLGSLCQRCGHSIVSELYTDDTAVCLDVFKI